MKRFGCSEVTVYVVAGPHDRFRTRRGHGPNSDVNTCRFTLEASHLE